MFGNGMQTLPELMGALVDALRERDRGAYDEAMRSIVGRVQQASPQELSEALEALRPVMEHIPFGMGVELARLSAGLVELGGDPLVLLETLALRVCDGLETATGFPAMWEVEAPGEKLPSSGEGDKIPFVMERVRSEQSGQAAEAYFTMPEWIPGLLLPLQQAVGRKALARNEELAARLIAAVEATAELIDGAHWLLGLLLVVDDEKIVVLHRASGRGYEMTIGGIGDNFQLHTLLAAHLIGDPARGLVEGTPPDPIWVAAASNSPDLQPEGGIRGQFNLVDFTGAWIWNEGRPLDIPKLDGVRVIVLDPEPYRRSWNTGRVYPLMYPTVTLDRQLSEVEAAGWLAKVSPAGRS
jgi:hypothetical protein